MLSSLVLLLIVGGLALFGVASLILLRRIRQLENRSKEIARQTEIQVHDFRKLDELKSEFISTVSHELRTPLTAIRGYVRLLLAGDAGVLTEVQRDFLGFVDANVARLTHLVNEVLDVEALEAGQLPVVLQPQNIHEILKECCDTFRVLAAQKNLELRYHESEKVSPVSGERGRLIQVFMNLLSNAIKYTDTGHVEITVIQHPSEVEIGIVDSGCGLKPDELELLFQKFYRTAAGVASGEGGTGLGLFIVKKLIEAQGGTISVTSEWGQGSQFSVVLPNWGYRAKGDPALKDGEHRNLDAVSSVLLAEDDEHIAKLIQYKLEKEGYHLVIAKNGQEAIELLGTQRWVLVILDVMMPLQNGWQVLKSLRATLGPETPVLMMTAKGRPADMEVAVLEGTTEFLKKPFDPAEFCTRVKKLASPPC